jgi:hypothetical protein
MSDRLTQADLLRFAYGEADELEEQVLSDPAYLAALEEIWAGELGNDLRPPIVRALQAQRFVADAFGAAIDVAIKFGAAVPHYMAAGERAETEVDRPEQEPVADGDEGTDPS